MKKFYYFLYFLIFLSIPPVYAYAGPGVAIGAIIVFITLLITFFASTILTIFKFVRQIIRLILKILNNAKKNFNQRKRKK